MSKHPMQKIKPDEHGVMRFTQNAIVRYLLDTSSYTMNDLARMPFDREDREQFLQLIGYSICGFDECQEVSDKASEKAHKRADKVEGVTEPPKKIDDNLQMDLAVKEIARLIKEVREYKEANPRAKCGHYLHYGSLLNAYREGDVSFDDCVELLAQVKPSEPPATSAPPALVPPPPASP